ncbi:type II CAAX prenyl endopeptidase Rce1 family protein [Aquihabitans daechungensis]|uniref:CPBP family glutamic-type intramembrane protease n=1 Tax=Aquihabitans daechungensis TaxID=1052257 RepID=UPI003B9F4DC8
MTLVQATDRAAKAHQGKLPVPAATNDLVSKLVAEGKIAPVPAIDAPASRVEQLSNRRTLVLGLSGITMLVEVLSLAHLLPPLWIGGIGLSFSLLPAMALGLACGSRLLGRSGVRRAAIWFWTIAGMLFATLTVLCYRQGQLDLVPALSAAALDEELVYRLAIPAVVAAALRLGNVRPNAARIAGLVAGALWFCLLPGHVEQMTSPITVVPYVAFATLSAFIVYRSGSILPLALGHAVSNLLTFLMFGAAVTADARGLALASVLCLLVLAYGRPRRITVGDDGGLIDTQTGLAVAAIDLRDGQPALVELADGRYLPVHADMVLPPEVPKVDRGDDGPTDLPVEQAS